VLGVVVAVAVAAAGLAVAEPAQRVAAPRAETPRAETPAPPERRHPLGRSVWELASDRLARERVIARGAFPVDGPYRDGAGDAVFGADRGGRMHEGQDIFGAVGTPLVAVLDGVVVQKGDDGGRGNYVAIFNRELGETYVYLHMQEPTSHEVGAPVSAGERVGRMGCTGSCWGDHLHFEAREGRGAEGRVLDPRPLLSRLPD
jgi:murein DD-endopeptidase MepM/ murein hydrolase activator NlpD